MNNVGHGGWEGDPVGRQGGRQDAGLTILCGIGELVALPPLGARALFASQREDNVTGVCSKVVRCSWRWRTGSGEVVT